MGLEFFEHVMRRPQKNREIACAGAEAEERRDPFEALAASVELSRQLNRDVVEESVRALDVRGEDVERHVKAGKGGAKKRGPRCEEARTIAAKNAMLECLVCEWPKGTDFFSLVHNRGFEVVRVWSGKLTITEYYFMRGMMQPYCVAELGAGAVASLPPGVVYRLETKGKEGACTLHFVTPPRALVPASEGIRRLYERRGISIL
ncbi:MAG: hypothetical protein Q7T16_03105 [Candidatus Burarchaeum sp.]|nr:hypothetical protein [Candidatus Burarchaeum sp.]MDO8339621.1 hypothetical protein [Candidatus Burarchaeum sp.]